MTQIKEIASDIYLLKVPLSLNVDHVNVYIFRGEVPTLLDTGTMISEVYNTIHDVLKKLGIRKLHQVLATHWHVDHAGGAAHFAKQGAKVFIGAKDYREWKSFAKGEMFELFREWAEHEWKTPSNIVQGMIKIYDDLRQMTVWPEETDIIKLDAWQTLRVGNILLRTIPTPGHTAGHLSFFVESQGLLFAGDMLLPDRIPYPGIWLEKGSVVSGLPNYLESLTTLEKLKPRKYFPAHGDPQTNLEERCQEVRTQILQQVDQYDPSLSVYEGALRLSQGKTNPGIFFMQLHYVFGWKKLYENLRTYSLS